MPRLTSVTAKWQTPEPSEAALGPTFRGSLPSPRLRPEALHCLSPRSPQPQPPQLRRRKRTPLSPHPHRPFFPASPALTCRSEGRGAPRGQARVPVVSGEDRAASRRPTEDPRLGRARRGLAAGERWQPTAVLLSAAARGQARPSAPRRRRRAPRSA